MLNLDAIGPGANHGGYYPFIRRVSIYVTVIGYAGRFIPFTVKAAFLGSVKLTAYVAAMALAWPSSVPAAEVPPIIERTYAAARLSYANHPASDEAAWQLARACFDRAEYARDDDERERLANEGIAACQKLLQRQPHLAAAHYYLGMDLAQLARTKKLGALPLLNQMKTQWDTAFALDKNIDYAGPDRNLGLLYRDAPGWPISLGSRRLAREDLARAVELSPGFPENGLNLIESELKWDDPAAAAQELAQLRLRLPAARKEFTGEYWAESWKDWDARFAKIQHDLQQTPEANRPNSKK